MKAVNSATLREPVATLAMPMPITAASEACRPTFSTGENRALSTVTRLPDRRTLSARAASRSSSRPSAPAAFTVGRAASTRWRSAPNSPVSVRLTRAARRSPRATPMEATLATPRQPTVTSSSQTSIRAIITTPPSTISPLRRICARLWVSAIFISAVSPTSRVCTSPCR